jgi:hypothetical protein
MKTKHIILISTIFVLLAVAIFYTTNNNITGFATYSENNYEEIDINKQFSTNNSLNETITQINENITSLLISGNYIGTGKIKIYLVDDNNEYLVYQEDTNSNNNLITGFVTKDAQNQNDFGTNTSEDVYGYEDAQNQNDFGSNADAYAVGIDEIKSNKKNDTENNATEENIEIIIEDEDNETPITFEDNQTETNTTEIIQDEPETNITEILIEDDTTIEENITEIIEEETKNITEQIIFEKECSQSCLFKSSSPTLKIHLEGNLIVNINSIYFAKETPITQIKEFNNVVLNLDENLEIDLSEYFYSTEEIFYDLNTDFDDAKIKKGILTITANEYGTSKIEIQASTGEKLLRAEFNIIVSQNFTHSTFIPWTNSINYCEKDCCYKTTYKQIGEIVTENNQQYICAINENSADWIKITGGVFQIKNSNKENLFTLDNFGNIWLSNSYCKNYQSTLNKFQVRDFTLYNNGILTIKNIQEQVSFTECSSCIKFKDKNNNILAQIKDETLEIKGNLYENQKYSDSCQ